MSWLKDLFTIPEQKSISQSELRHPSRQFLWFDFTQGPDLTEMQSEVGDGTSSDVLMTPLRWVQRSILEAPVVEVDENDDPAPGRLQELLDEPNPFYAWEHLLAGTIYSLILDGNAYWLCIEDGNGDLAELWYAPHTLIDPKWDDANQTFITHYEYTAGGVTQEFDPEDVVHFRDGLDPANNRKGLSPVKGLLRRIWTDREIAMFASGLLRNGGVPGIVVSPASPEYTITKQEANAAEEKIDAKVTRTNRGRTLVMTGPTKIEQFGFSPQQLDLTPLANVSEERLCAALGVQAAVVGFGSGMHQTKVGATMQELRLLSWTNGVLPLQRIIEGEIDRTIGPMVDSAGIMFDNEQVEALREGQDSRSRRIVEQYRAGIITRTVAKSELGYEPDDADEVYFVPFSGSLIPAGTLQPQPLADVVPFERANTERETKHHGTTLERRIVSENPQVTPPAELRRLASVLDDLRDSAETGLAAALVEIFQRLGREAGAVARRVLSEARSAPGHETKDAEEDEIIRLIMEGLEFGAASERMSEAYHSTFLGMSESAIAALAETLGVVIELTDPMQLEILRRGGTRAGLIDLEQQTREALFEALAEAREEGLAGENLARRIRERIEAGPWRDVETRARVIARTEGANAANISVLEGSRAIEGVELMLVHDNRTGHGDEICSEMDGRVVTIAEAEAMGLAHPNCTRSFTPIPPLLAQEMGL